jgi:hypothetical protein
MSGKHTPGPWTAIEQAKSAIDGQPGFSILPEGARPSNGAVAKIPPSTYRPTRENAYLIAAAPDLLAALEWYVQDDEENGATTTDLYHQAKAVIFKARGASLPEASASGITTNEP